MADKHTISPIEFMELFHCSRNLNAYILPDRHTVPAKNGVPACPRNGCKIDIEPAPLTCDLPHIYWMIQTIAGCAGAGLPASLMASLCSLQTVSILSFFSTNWLAERKSKMLI